MVVLRGDRPGLAVGPRPLPVAVAVVETDVCAVDAIQFLTGCTFGKSNLVHRDYGKNAYAFFRRSDGRAIRVVARPDAWQRDPEHQRLFAKVRDGSASDAERARFRDLHQSQSRALLSLDPHDLFFVTEVDGPPPRMARIHGSVPCAHCGEGVMETRVRRLGGRELCQPCFDAAMADG